MVGASGLTMETFVIFDAKNLSSATCNELSIVLGAEGAGTKKYFGSMCYQKELYKILFPSPGLRLSITESKAGKVMVLPTGTAVRLNYLNSMCDIIRLTINEPGTIEKQSIEYLAEGNVR